MALPSRNHNRWNAVGNRWHHAVRFDKNTPSCSATSLKQKNHAPILVSPTPPLNRNRLNRNRPIPPQSSSWNCIYLLLFCCCCCCVRNTHSTWYQGNDARRRIDPSRDCLSESPMEKYAAIMRTERRRRRHWLEGGSLSLSCSNCGPCCSRSGRGSAARVISACVFRTRIFFW